MSETIQFGKNSHLVGIISDPRSSSSRDKGVVVWGVGLAELRTVKRLSAMGITSMQVDRRSYDGEPNRAIGVKLCVEAIDELKRRRGSETYILMGVCAMASVCLNTALIDPRVGGLILVNPHVSERLSYWPTIRNRILSWASWKRALTGRAHFGVHFKKALLIARVLMSKKFAENHNSMLVATVGDTTLPEDIESSLSALAGRGVATLLICSEDDPSLHYFRDAFGEDVNMLTRVPGTSFRILPNAPHLLSEDVGASLRLEDIVAGWLELVQTGEYAIDSQRSDNIVAP